MKPPELLSQLQGAAEIPALAPFFRRAFGLELLLLIDQAQREGRGLGIEECFEALTIAKPTRGTFARFFRELVLEEVVLADVSASKRSKREVRLAPEVSRALRRLFR
ncbi:MAG: hypothetical protein O2811_05190 [Proteobacteria bacterium]|nr:hypothetical protein [Pseudomonadota bacterium]